MVYYICMYIILVGKHPPPHGRNLEVLETPPPFTPGETSWVGKSPGATGNKATWAVLRRFKTAVLNQNEGLFGNIFLGKLIWDEVFYYGIFAEYVQIYTSIWSLKQFEINLFWDQCIYYSILCFILPVGDSQTGVYLRQNTPEEAERWGFPRNSFYAKRLSLWTRFDWLFGNSWYDMKK